MTLAFSIFGIPVRIHFAFVMVGLFVAALIF